MSRTPSTPFILRPGRPFLGRRLSGPHQRFGSGRRALGALWLILALLLGAAPCKAQESQPQSQDPAESSGDSAGEAARGEAAPVAGPMELFIRFSRAQLAGLGFERHQAEIEQQPFVWWEKTPSPKTDGGSGKPALVMIHGVSDQAGTWFQTAGPLAQDRKVLLVDLPGHGGSGPSQGPLAMSRIQGAFETWLQHHAFEPEPEILGIASVDEAARDRAAKDRAAGGGPATESEGEGEGEGTKPEAAAPVLVGNSMGAWVALLTALRHPRLVSRVVAVNGGGLSADTGELDLLPESREEARRLMAALRDPSNPPTPDVVLDDLVRRVPGGQVSRMFEVEADMDAHLLDQRLDRITVPVDLLWGESDRFLGSQYPRSLEAGLPSSRLTFLPHCGHLPQAECPALFAAELRRLLETDPPSPSPSQSPSPAPPNKEPLP